MSGARCEQGDADSAAFGDGGLLRPNAVKIAASQSPKRERSRWMEALR